MGSESLDEATRQLVDFKLEDGSLDEKAIEEAKNYMTHPTLPFKDIQNRIIDRLMKELDLSSASEKYARANHLADLALTVMHGSGYGAAWDALGFYGVQIAMYIHNAEQQK